MLISTNAKSQNNFNNFTISKVTQDDGLSQGSNYYRFEDSLGFVWLTGNDAVNRYDGNYVKVYNKDYYFKNCKNLQQGYGFVEDNNQNIYTGSTVGLYVYTRKKDQFTLKKLLSEFNDQTVFPIGFADGKVWCHNKDFDIIAFDVKSQQSNIFKTRSKYKVASFHIYDNAISPIITRLPFIDNQQHIWIINPKGIQRFNTKTKESNQYLEKYLLTNNLTIFSSCYNVNNNSILLGVSDGLLEFDCTAKSIVKKIKSSRITIVAVDKSKVVVKNKTHIDFYDTNFKIQYSQKLENIFATSYTYSFDKMERLWVCRDGFGQIIVDFKASILNKITSENGLTNTGVSHFAEFDDGTFLIENEYIFNKKTIDVIKSKDIYLKEHIKSQTLSDIKNKIIWVAEQKKDGILNIYKIDQKKQQKLYHTFSNTENLGVFQDAIFLDNNLLCSFQDGLYKIDLKLKTITKLRNQQKRNPFKINSISKNRFIVSYLNQEATVYAINNYEIVKAQNILKGYQPFYFEEDMRKKIIWVGTNNGVFVVDSNYKIIKKIDANTDIAGTYIYGILLDIEGNCWASHQRGLSLINTINYKIINFNKEDGIQDWDFNNRAYYKATDGTLFFGGMNGFNYFKPPIKYNNSIYKSQVYIDEILINQRKLKNEINHDNIKKLILNPNQNNLSFHAIVRNIYKGNQFQIIYRINNSKWIFKKSNCTIDLVNLSPDNYAIDLGYYDKFENKFVKQKTLKLFIKAPFYYKTWFWMLISFVSAGFLFWIFNRRKFAKQKQIFQQQLALEKQRNKITADLHDEIGATLSSLQINSTVANRLMENDATSAHEVLQKIENQAKSIADKIGDIIWSMKPGKDEFMTLSTRIKNYCNEVLGSTNINYTIEIDSQIDTIIKEFSVRKNILLITKEALNNILKYSQASKIKVMIEYKNNVVLLIISDNGIGFNPATVMGNGIGNMKTRAKELNADFELISKANLGTIIQVQFKFIP